MINIDYLGCHSQFTSILAQWHQDEWSKINPGLTTSKRIDLYNSYKSEAAIPSCLIAISDDKLAGSASLVISDMDTHDHLTPWLASVYVHENFRSQGIASQLIQRIIENAHQCGAKILYLFTADQSSFYMKRGWNKLETTEYHGELVDIMYYDLNSI
ncbi:MAG: GNAT family N-acetyltransferase [Gammaproteobacteria bacterium]|nr:GNAT family N-acetyltransferase [Gammaproteobacteria bacterium]